MIDVNRVWSVSGRLGLLICWTRVAQVFDLVTSQDWSDDDGRHDTIFLLLCFFLLFISALSSVPQVLE